MANYIVSYDLNGPVPTHAQMDVHIAKKTAWSRGRVLETVWYIKTDDPPIQVYDYINSILSINDRLLVVEAVGANWRNLLITDASLKRFWEA